MDQLLWGGYGIVTRTTDGGATWNYSNSLGSVCVQDIAVDPVDTSRGYITTGHYGRQVQRSLDGGVLFNAVLNGINQAGQAYSMNPNVAKVGGLQSQGDKGAAQSASMRYSFNTHTGLPTFCHLFYATLG